MAVSSKQQKDSVSGKKENSASTPKKGSVIQRVASYLKISDSPRVQLKPTNKKLGYVMYRVDWQGFNALFTRLADARHFKRLLKKSAPVVEPVIIRTDTTEDGYIVDERVIK